MSEIMLVSIFHDTQVNKFLKMLVLNACESSHAFNDSMSLDSSGGSVLVNTALLSMYVSENNGDKCHVCLQNKTRLSIALTLKFGIKKN